MPILIFKQWSSFSLLTWQACWPFHIWAKSWSSLCIYDQGWFKHYICFVHSFFTSLVIFIIFHFYIFRTKKGHWIILTRNLYHLSNLPNLDQKPKLSWLLTFSLLRPRWTECRRVHVTLILPLPKSGGHNVDCSDSLLLLLCQLSL